MAGLHSAGARGAASIADPAGTLETLNCANPEGTWRRLDFALSGGNAVTWTKNHATVAITSEVILPAGWEAVASEDESYKFKSLVADVELTLVDGTVFRDVVICRAIFAKPR